MLGEPENQFSLTRAALSTCGAPKQIAISREIAMNAPRIAALFAFVLAALNIPQTLAITFTTLDVPGAASTRTQGIDANNIVGYYTDSFWHGHGFLSDGSSYTTLDHPLGVGGTFPSGISGGLIVVSWCDQNWKGPCDQNWKSGVAV